MNNKPLSKSARRRQNRTRNQQQLTKVGTQDQLEGPYKICPQCGEKVARYEFAQHFDYTCKRKMKTINGSISSYDVKPYTGTGRVCERCGCSGTLVIYGSNNLNPSGVCLCPDCKRFLDVDRDGPDAMLSAVRG